MTDDKAKTVRIRVSFEYEIPNTPGWWRGIRSERADLLCKLMNIGAPLKHLCVKRVEKAKRGKP